MAYKEIIFFNIPLGMYLLFGVLAPSLYLWVLNDSI